MSALYARVASLRRSWYSRPHARARLSHPVISVGNLVVGGSGKTPLVATLARELASWGERPAILSRGYGRRRQAEGVVVVSDRSGVRAPVEDAGDEPLMLARALPGVPVLVSAERHLAGRLAERQFEATVLLLDDGFQHLQLARDVDVLVVAPADLEDLVLPSGRLREPLDAARTADAVIVYAAAEEARRVADALGVTQAFTAERRYGPVRTIAGRPSPPGSRVLAVAGVARPERFFSALRENGFDVAREVTFRDHHWFTEADVSRVVDAASAVHADAIVTTEKDAVRIERLGVDPARWAVLPLDVVIEPADDFRAWLRSRLAAARGRETA